MRVISGRVFFRGRLEPLSIGIDETGQIAAIKKVLRSDDEIDHGDSLILPGCVDLHVHMRDPGLRHKEDFPSGTRSAAIGGVTTVADMPNTVPAVTTAMALDEKAAALRGRASVDYVLYAAPQSGAAVPRLANAVAFKVFMAELQFMACEKRVNDNGRADQWQRHEREPDFRAGKILSRNRADLRAYRSAGVHHERDQNINVAFDRVGKSSIAG